MTIIRFEDLDGNLKEGKLLNRYTIIPNNNELKPGDDIFFQWAEEKEIYEPLNIPKIWRGVYVKSLSEDVTEETYIHVISKSGYEWPNSKFDCDIQLKDLVKDTDLVYEVEVKLMDNHFNITFHTICLDYKYIISEEDSESEEKKWEKEQSLYSSTSSSFSSSSPFTTLSPSSSALSYIFNENEETFPDFSSSPFSLLSEEKEENPFFPQLQSLYNSLFLPHLQDINKTDLNLTVYAEVIEIKDIKKLTNTLDKKHIFFFLHYEQTIHLGIIMLPSTMSDHNLSPLLVIRGDSYLRSKLMQYFSTEKLNIKLAPKVDFVSISEDPMKWAGELFTEKEKKEDGDILTSFFQILTTSKNNNINSSSLSLCTSYSTSPEKEYIAEGLFDYLFCYQLIVKLKKNPELWKVIKKNFICDLHDEVVKNICSLTIDHDEIESIFQKSNFGGNSKTKRKILIYEKMEIKEELPLPNTLKNLYKIFRWRREKTTFTYLKNYNHQPFTGTKDEIQRFKIEREKDIKNLFVQISIKYEFLALDNSKNILYDDENEIIKMPLKKGKNFNNTLSFMDNKIHITSHTLEDLFDVTYKNIFQSEEYYPLEIFFNDFKTNTGDNKSLIEYPEEMVCQHRHCYNEGSKNLFSNLTSMINNKKQKN